MRRWSAGGGWREPPPLQEIVRSNAIKPLGLDLESLGDRISPATLQ